MDERITTAGIAMKGGKVLIAKRISGGALSDKWEFPGGKNRYGETAEDTLKREWKEELGIDIEVGDEVFSFDFTNKDTLYHLKCFMITLLSEDFTLSVHTEVRFVGPEELSRYSFGGSDTQIASFLMNKS